MVRTIIEVMRSIGMFEGDRMKQNACSIYNFCDFFGGFIFYNAHVSREKIKFRV